MIAVVASGIAAQKVVAGTYQLCRFVCPDVIGPIPLINEVLSKMAPLSNADGSGTDSIFVGPALILPISFLAQHTRY